MSKKQKQISSIEQNIILRALAESAARPGCKFIEVGSWYGESTIILGKIAQKNGGYLFCVDWWKGNIGTDLEDIAKKKDIFSFFWKKICAEGLEDIVIPIRGHSDIAAKVLKEQTFDLVFLDGDHRFEAILNDIKEYAPLVRKENGVLCGHDCDGYISDFDMDLIEKGKNLDVYEGVHCGVVLAVGTVFKNYSIDHNIWSVRTSEENQDWQLTNLQFPIPKRVETYNSFDLIRYRNRIYAIHNSVGLVDLSREEKNILDEHQKFGRCIVGKSLEEVKHLIEQIGHHVTPVLLKEGYKTFNIILYKNKYYAVAQSLGVIDFTRIRENKLKDYEEHGKCVIADSLVEAELLVDQITDFLVPKLVEDGYSGFNIIFYHKKYHALSQDLQSIDLASIDEVVLSEYKNQGKYGVGGSIYEVKYYIDKLYFQHLQKVIEDVNKNIGILQRDISATGTKTETLNKEILEKVGHVNKLNADIAGLNKTLEFLQANLSERDKTIEALKSDISHRDEAIAKLNADIQAHSKKIDALQSDLTVP